MPLVESSLLTLAQGAANSRQPLVESGSNQVRRSCQASPRCLNLSPRRRAKPSKPNAVNAIGMSKMSVKFRKQTHGCYHP